MTQDAQGEWIIPSLPESTKLTIDKEKGTATLSYTPNTIQTVDGEDGTSQVVTSAPDTSKTVTQTFNLVNGTDKLSKKEVMQRAIINGNLFVIDTSKLDNGSIGMDLLEPNTEMYYELDTSDDAKAESQYQYETAKLSRQDNMLEMDMKQLETQHDAVLKEYDSVKEVISNNVERTFKLFSNG